MIELALIPLTTATTRAKSAGYRQPPRRRARTAKATIHGRPAQGRRMTEMRPAYWRKYGDSMNASAATTRPGPRTARTRAEVEDAGPGGEQDAAEPQPLGHPRRHVDRGGQRVERPHRQQVADVLVRDRPEGDGRVPHPGHLAEEPAGVEVEVRLRVRRHDAPVDDEERDERQRGHRDVLQPVDDADPLDGPVGGPPVGGRRVHLGALRRRSSAGGSSATGGPRAGRRCGCGCRRRHVQQWRGPGRPSRSSGPDGPAAERPRALPVPRPGTLPSRAAPVV